MEKIVKCVGVSKQPELILKIMAGHDLTGGSTDPVHVACEQ